MVLKRKIDYGLNGFRVAAIPRAPRSIRRRSPHTRTVENSQICAFELLASLAGKLLQESENSSASSNASEGNDQHASGKTVVKQEQEASDKPLKVELQDNHSSEESNSVSELAAQKINQNCYQKEPNHNGSDGNLECTSIISRSVCSEKVSCDVKSVNCESKTVLGKFPCKIELTSLDFGKDCISHIDIGNEMQDAEQGRNEVLSKVNPYDFKDPVDNKCGSPKLSLGRDPIPNASFSKYRNDFTLGSRDDDENFSRFNKLSTKYKAYRPPPRIGDRRIRKLLTSKYWKVAPKLKDSELSTTRRLHNGGGWKPVNYKRKNSYDHGRCHHSGVYKKCKMFDQSSVVISDGGCSSESVSNSPEKVMDGDNIVSAGNFHGGHNHQTRIHLKNSHVKFSVKSFRVPELFVEVPETATVGSLKRTVMEAVTTLLGGGLHVGVLLHGKKLRDDNRTLLQTGLACKENLDTLGFTLEPNPAKNPPSPVVKTEDPPLLPYDNTQPLNRSSLPPTVDSGIDDSSADLAPLSNASNHVENNHESATSPVDVLTDKEITDSRALVVVPPVSMDALAVVPLNHKSKRSEFVQRRTRRPFSVAEVEALVQAVEELGTGRWRDVKLRAFENADHRTYVDLKDKWKTLVHTAKISPQQRRGEPVPQDLLDRVLAAHAYWSQRQAKPHGKHHIGNLKISDAQADGSGGAGI